MNKEKFKSVVDELRALTSDYLFIETTEVKDLTANLIVEKARELIDIVDEENAPSRPAKSELARNCKCDEDDNKLKPCPFCGEKIVVNFGFSPDREYPRFYCDNCDMLFRLLRKDLNKEEIVARWNCRNLTKEFD